MAIIKNYFIELLSKYITQKDKHKKFTSKFHIFSQTNLIMIYFNYTSYSLVDN